jgi:iron complex outermembrane receptor protein
MRKSAWLILALYAYCLHASGQVSIQLLDKETLQPVYQAQAWFSNRNISFASEETGRIYVPISEETEVLSIQAPGYLLFTVRWPLPDTIYLEPLPYLSEVVIESVRGGSLFPLSEKTLSKEAIEQASYGQDATDLLQQTPGVYANFQSGVPFTNYSDIRIRGMEQSRINITLDGIPLNDALDQGVFFSNFTDFGNSVQSIQVQRGVGTSTSGVASYAGSINFESMSLLDTAPSAEVQVGVGSFYTRRGSVEAKTGITAKGLSAYVRYSELATDGYRVHSGTQSRSFFGSAGYYGKKDILKVIAFSGRTQNELAFLPEPLSILRQNRRANSLSQNMTDDFGQSLVGVQYHRFLTTRQTIALTAYHGWAGGIFEVNDSLVFGLQNNHTGAMLHYSYKPSRGAEVHAGVQSNVFRRENYATFIPLETNRLYTNYGEKIETSAFVKGGYQKGRFAISGDLQVRSVYFEYIADRSYGIRVAPIEWLFFNPKAALTYRINREQQLYVSYGGSGREPTRRDLLVGLDDITAANKDTAGNFRAIQPEYVQDLEVGYQYNGRIVSLRVNYFNMQFRNEITATGAFTSWGEMLRRNVPQSRRQGIEIDISYRPLEWLRLTHTSAFTSAEIKEYANEAQNLRYRNVTPLLTPALIVNDAVSVIHPTLGSFTLSSRFVSRSFLTNENIGNFYLPAFYVMNATLQVYFLKQHSISIQANNLLDQTYFTQGTVFGLFTEAPEAAYFAQAGFNLMGTVRLRF